MTRTTTNLIGIIIAILAGTYFYIMYCSECSINVKEEPVKEVMVPIVPEATSYPFAFNNGDYTYNVNDNYNFNISSSFIVMPLSQNVGKVINITGYYKSDETNNSAFPNLGLARANAVKNHFTGNGIVAAKTLLHQKNSKAILPKKERLRIEEPL